MKIEHVENNKRKLVGMLRDGALYMNFRDNRFPEERTVVIGSADNPDNVIKVNGTANLQALLDKSYGSEATPLYEGDSITITF